VCLDVRGVGGAGEERKGKRKREKARREARDRFEWVRERGRERESNCAE